MAYKKILFRRDTAANWTSENPVLALGEIGLEYDTDHIKLGDGASSWTELGYFYGNLDSTSINALADVTIAGTASGQFLRWNGTAWVNSSSATAVFTGAEIDNVRIGVTGANEIDTLTGNLTIDSAGGTTTIDDDLVVSGNLTVSGTTTTVNTETVTIADNIIVLNSDETSTPTANAGIEVERGTSTNVLLRWNESNDVWEITTNGTDFYQLARVLDIDEKLALDTWHEPARLATAAVLPNSPTYSAGSAGADGVGVGATLTATVNARLVVDQEEVNVGNRILVKNQANAAHNGVYVVTVHGSASANYVLTRATDFNGSFTRQIGFGDALYVAGGFANGLQTFGVSDDGSGANSQIIFGTDNINFEQISGTATIQAGNGLTATGNSIDIVPGAGLVVSANEIDLGTINQSNNTASVPGSLFIQSLQVDGYGRITGATSASVEVALGSQTTGSYVAGINAGDGVTVTNSGSEGATPTIAIGQSVATNASVSFASVSAQTIAGPLTGNVVGNLTGNATTASALQTGRTITLSGDVTGAVTFDGSQAVTLATTIAPDSLTLGVDTTGNYLLDVTAGTGVTVSHVQSEGSSATISIGQSVATNASVTFNHVTADLLGNVTGNVTGNITGNVVGNVTGDITGNAGTATTLQTARNIAGQSFNGSANISIAPTDLTGVTSTAAEINILDGATLSTTELNYVDGVTSAIQTQLDAKAPLASPALTGTPTAPTAELATNTTQVATTAFVRAEVAALVNSAGSTLDTLGEIATALGNDANLSTTLTNSIGLKANTASPTFTGTVTIPTGASITLPTISSGANYAGSTSGQTKLEASATASGTITLPAVTGTVVTTGDTGTVTSTMLVDGTIVDADINASAAIALSKLATSTAGNVIVYNSAGVPTSVTKTGDVTISDTGVTAISSGVIVDADISASAAITLSKLATSTAGNIIVYNASGVPTSVTESGDVVIDSSGVTAISSGVIVDADISDSAAIAMSKIADVSTNAQTASYTLVLADKNKIVEMNVGSANNLTIPLNSSVAFPTGSQINVLQTGTGQTTIVGAGGVTVNGTPGLKVRAQYSYVSLIKRAENTWVAVGDLSA